MWMEKSRLSFFSMTIRDGGSPGFARLPVMQKCEASPGRNERRPSRYCDGPSDVRAEKEGDSDPPWHRHPVCRPPWKRRKEYYERVSSISGFCHPLHPKYSSALDRSKNDGKIPTPVTDGSVRVEPAGQLPLVAPKSIHYDRATTRTVAKDPNEDCRCYRFPIPC